MAVPFAVITLLLVFVVSLLIVRTGTIALAMTGMSEEVASFQAASAFSGAGFTTDETEQIVLSPQRRRIIKLPIGTIVIVLFVRSRWFDRVLSPALGRLLTQTTTLNVNDYAHLLELREGYRVAELTVNEDGWLSHESLRDLRLAHEGVVVLGINREDGSYASPPDPDVILHPGDVLIAYGRKDRLTELSMRSDSDETAHEEAIEDHIRDSEGSEFPSHS
jgi:uncharacterized transporter YbjL